MGIFEKTLHDDPEYKHLEKYVHIMYRGFWTPAKYEKLIKEVDAPRFYNSMKELDKETIKRCIMAVNLVEDKVKTYWSSLSLYIPQVIVGDVGGLFGMSEVTHRRSYNALSEVLNVDTESLSEHKALKGRVEYLGKYLEKDSSLRAKKAILKKLVLFTSLVERCSLFTQFYILMSYAYNNQGLNSISALQESTAIEEIQHYSFGIDLINIIKRQYPDLWDEQMINLVEKNIQEAYEAEVKLIEWFFEKGVPEHLSKEEVINFLNYNFNVVCKDLKLNIEYPVDMQMFKEKNEWFKVKVFMTSEPDFFDNAVPGYASEQKDIDINSFEL